MFGDVFGYLAPGQARLRQLSELAAELLACVEAVVPRIRVPFLVPVTIKCRNMFVKQKGPMILEIAHNN